MSPKPPALPPAVSTTRYWRARERATESQRESRVREVMAMISAGQFTVGKTAVELSTRWGLHLATVHSYTAEAWRRHGAEIVDPQRVKVKLADVLEQVIDDALKDTKEPALIDGGGERGVYQESPNGARRVVVEAAKTLGALVGTSEVLAPSWDTLSLEEKWAAVDRAQAKVDAVRATLPARSESPEPGDGS